MSDARDRLLEAIREVDAEIFDRGPGEIMTGFVVVVAHRTRWRVTRMRVGDQVTRITMPGQAAWMSLGMLRAQQLALEAMFTGPVEEDP